MKLGTGHYSDDLETQEKLECFCLLRCIDPCRPSPGFSTAYTASSSHWQVAPDLKAQKTNVPGPGPLQGSSRPTETCAGDHLACISVQGSHLLGDLQLGKPEALVGSEDPRATQGSP